MTFCLIVRIVSLEYKRELSNIRYKIKNYINNKIKYKTKDKV